MNFFICLLLVAIVNAEGPPCTKDHEHYTTCGKYCPVTCANLNNTEPVGCAAVCFVGCECDDGFYREYGRFIGNCVRKEDCPDPQGETIYVGSHVSSLTSSETISHISYDEDSIVRSPSSRNAPPSSDSFPIASPSSSFSGDSGFFSYESDSAPSSPETPKGAVVDGNYFYLRYECRADPPEMCPLTDPPTYGYFYHKEAERCEPFPFANCGGSPNNFKTKKECIDHCLPFKSGKEE